MDALFAQGPIRGSALFVERPRRAPMPIADEPAYGAHARRQIGPGKRSIVLTRPARHARRRLARSTMVPRKKVMNRTALFAASFLALFMLSAAAVGIGASMDSPPTLMSPADYGVAKRAIESQTRAASARCRGTQGTQRDVCKAEVRAAERVKKADLAARYHGTVAAADEARQVRVNAQYEVARARCGGRVGEERTQCIRAAREDRNKSVAEPRLAST